MQTDLEKKYRQSVNTFEISKKQESDLTVKSNINGIIYDILKEPGEFVTTQTPIAIVGAAGRFEIELQVSPHRADETPARVHWGRSCSTVRACSQRSAQPRGP